MRDDSKTVLEDASAQEDDRSKACYRGQQVLDAPQQRTLLAFQLGENYIDMLSLLILATLS